MKFSYVGRIALALMASLALIIGTQSCSYNYTEAYIIVTGSQYNQVATYREDNDTGQLTNTNHGIVSSGGSNPIRATLLNGGRYVYVLNQGTPSADSSGNITWTGANISLFSIGGQGSLSYQLSYPSQGLGSRRLVLSASGTYLYVLDQYQPGSTPNQTPASTTQSAAFPCYDSTYNVYRPAGDITAFSIDASTGRLFLLQNQQQQNNLGTPLSYFPIGCGAIDLYMGSNYLYTAEASDPTSGYTQAVYAYAASGTTGQLTQVPTPAQPITGATNITVINGSASKGYIYVLDSGTNTIFAFTPGSNGLLTALSVPSVPNNPETGGMTALTTDSASKYLYITNTESLGVGQPASQLSIFTITPGSGQLVAATPPTYSEGATPVCVFEDPSKQYMYTADAGSSQVTGAAFDPNTGTLTSLPRGSQFGVVGTPTWCLYSSNTD
jgi:6-phosphogluconolactonase (cycloisomerase 2 family)